MNHKAKKISSSLSRNPFVAVSEYASRNNWCWKIFCTTCAHGSFRVAFSKLIRGEHPDKESFWPQNTETQMLHQEIDNFNDFYRGTASDNENQIKLAQIVAQAKLSDINNVAKYPDWLGYIGLVLTHCPNRESRKIISDSFLPQFITMLKGNKDMVRFLKNKKSKDELLSVDDLGMIEKNFNNNQ